MNTRTAPDPTGDRHLSSISMTSPIGRLEIVAHDTAVVAIRWDTDSDDAEPDARNPARLGGVHEVAAGDHPVLDRAVVELTEYFDGTRTEFGLPIDPDGTPFQRAAWAVLTQIPFGETVSYGEQARMLGDVNKSRAVGAANGRNPIPIVVPCHRVVGRDGRLTGFAGGLSTKAWLLDHELAVRTCG
jgi:methylated-DNA-[protein]-cysteine S-methyltransferase